MNEANIYVFRRYSETTKRASTYEVVASSEQEARETLKRRFGKQIAAEATLEKVKSERS